MVSGDEIELLYDPKRGQYKGVYSVRKNRYIAAVFRAPRFNSRTGKWITGMIYLGYVKAPQEGAELIVRYYKKHYGALWRVVMLRGHRRVTVVRSVPGGYAASAWVNGREVKITPKTLPQVESVLDVRSHWSEDLECWTSRLVANLASRVFAKGFSTDEPDDSRPVLFRLQ